jgi:hypothetical protein
MHVNWSAVATVLSILISGATVTKSLNRIAEAFRVGVWEHKVLWGWFSREHPDKIPEYPRLH